jgi:hypothetical protein
MKESRRDWDGMCELDVGWGWGCAWAEDGIWEMGNGEWD